MRFSKLLFGSALTVLDKSSEAPVKLESYDHGSPKTLPVRLQANLGSEGKASNEESMLLSGSESIHPKLRRP